MAAVQSLDELLEARRVWRGPGAAAPDSAPQPTGHAALDAALPHGGWPDPGLSEILLPADGLGEVAMVWPTLARLTAAGHAVAVVAPPYHPHAPAWHSAGLDLRRLHVVRAGPRDALWAAEQCLRSGAFKAVLCWPQRADDRSLRRLAVAAETGQALGLAFRSLREAANPSPAALRLAMDGRAAVRVLKCRGGNAPRQAFALADRRH